ncbi:MAG: CotS family spore coat protein [Marinisporobacter sp.]|jgi:CotS family spore coat protein|nr:CotS family spore coat protein [Marinisporobacter sp.]
MNDLKRVLNEYDIDILSIKTQYYKGKKGVWWIQTLDDYMILKKQEYLDKTLECIIAAMEHLVNNGIYMPKIIKTKRGNKYVLINRDSYILSEAINGKTLDYNSFENIKRIVEALANFHKASVGFTPPQTCKIRTHLGTWITEYEEEIDRLKKYYYMECNKEIHTEFGKEILKEFPYFHKRMKNAMNDFNGSSYYKWVKEFENTGGLCYEDFTAEKITFTDIDEIYVLDPDSITIDIPLRDIRKILNEIMKKKKKWDSLLLKNILNWYQMINPLKPYEWEVLKADLTYPHLFVAIMSKYYEKREKAWSEEKYLSYLKEMIKIDKSLEYIIQSFDKILPA